MRLLTVLVVLAAIGSACGLNSTPRPPTRTPRPTITATFPATEAVTVDPQTLITPETTDGPSTESSGPDLTLTPDLSTTPSPTVTATRRAVTVRAPAAQLEISNILLVGVARDPSRENGAIASVQVVFSGGRAPYTIMHDEDLVSGNPFPVLTVCNGTLIHTIKLTSEDRQVVTKKYYLAPVACPP